MSENDIINQNILSRDLLIEVILTAVLISFGLNLFVASFSNINEFNGLMFIIGTATILISLIMLVYKNFKKFDRTVKLTGFFIYDAKNNDLVDIPNYNLSNELVSYLKAAFEEDESLGIIWNKVPLINRSSDCGDQYPTSSKEIIQELFEYFVINRLSLTLEHFFKDESFKKKDLKEYGRDDIPSTLLNNRFLSLFSKPLEERKAYFDENLEEEGVFLEHEGERTLFMRIGNDKTLYQRLHLILPKNIKIKRHNPQGIVLESDQMVINFDIIFDGFNVLLPPNFQKYYLNLKNEFMSFDESEDIYKYQFFQLDLKIDIKFKIKSLFSNTLWRYNKWLDSYLNLLNEEVSMNAFFESIQWSQIETFLYMLEKNKLFDIKKKS